MTEVLQELVCAYSVPKSAGRIGQSILSYLYHLGIVIETTVQHISRSLGNGTIILCNKGWGLSTGDRPVCISAVVAEATFFDK